MPTPPKRYTRPKTPRTAPALSEPEKFYMTLELPGWVREKFAKIAETNKRSMKAQGEYIILDVVQKFDNSQTEIPTAA